ncbi:LysR family transcriptional regulator [Actinomadura luteofluorescens]|uniref:LysR family transcriptional regulator n=1 Tax=Actinomadura luteofluorescens TaxID=46163 RepID=UPI00348BF3A6
MELDLGAVRAFLAVVDDGRFTDAADRMDMTQQAVSKRIAKLEAALGVPLLRRTRAGARPTEDGAAFLPQARALISLADQATAMLRARHRPLRIDVLGHNSAPIEIVRSFYETGDAEVDIVVSRGAGSRWTALTDGSIDAAFGRVTGPLPPGVNRVPAALEPIPILVGDRHRLADHRHVPMSELSGSTAWMPGNTPESEWADYYRHLGAEFGVHIDTSGPAFGRDHIMEKVGASPDLITFGNKTQFPGHPDVVQIAITDPTPAYPWSLMWHDANRHPSLPDFVTHAQDHYHPQAQWLPAPDRPHFPTAQ